MSKSKSKSKKPVVNPFKVRTSRAAVGRQVREAAMRPLVGANAAAEEAREILMRLAEVKPLYKRLEELTDALHGVDLSEYGMVMVDNFSSTNCVWKSVATRRWELKITK